MTKRELDVFFLQFSWLTPAGEGRRLHDLLTTHGLAGRWMPEASRPHNQYLGEQGWSPIAQHQFLSEAEDQPEILKNAQVLARPVAEKYFWEGNVLDCSIDEGVDLYAPSPELLGDAEWVGFKAQWVSGGRVIAKSVRLNNGENSQDALLAERSWLEARLHQLGADLVIGTLSEKHAVADDDDARDMAFSDVWYSACVSPDQANCISGPIVRERVRDDSRSHIVPLYDVDNGNDPSDDRRGILSE